MPTQTLVKTPRVTVNPSNPHNIPEEMRTRCEVWTRCLGYHRPVANFNIGKKQEARERTYFAEQKTLENAKCCGSM